MPSHWSLATWALISKGLSCLVLTTFHSLWFQWVCVLLNPLKVREAEGIIPFFQIHIINMTTLNGNIICVLRQQACSWWQGICLGFTSVLLHWLKWLAYSGVKRDKSAPKDKKSSITQQFWSWKCYRKSTWKTNMLSYQDKKRHASLGAIVLRSCSHRKIQFLLTAAVGKNISNLISLAPPFFIAQKDSFPQSFFFLKTLPTKSLIKVNGDIQSENKLGQGDKPEIR